MQRRNRVSRITGPRCVVSRYHRSSTLIHVSSVHVAVRGVQVHIKRVLRLMIIYQVGGCRRVPVCGDGQGRTQRRKSRRNRERTRQWRWSRRLGFVVGVVVFISVLVRLCRDVCVRGHECVLGVELGLGPGFR